jgi:hypothetical protein
MTQRVLLGTLGAIAGALLGAVAWGGISAATHFQIGYMAVGVGFLAGYGMRTLGGGRDRVDGVIAAVVAVLGCVLGNVLSAVIDFAPHDDAHRSVVDLTMVVLLHPKVAWFMLSENFNIMDVVFYVLAILAGYRTALKPPAPVMSAADVPPPAANQL